MSARRSNDFRDPLGARDRETPLPLSEKILCALMVVLIVVAVIAATA